MKLAIIDYGAGNIANVKNAFEKLGVCATVSDDSTVWKTADALVFPGVGAFGSTIKSLGKKTLALRKYILQGTPFLGICLGMQLLMEKSEENPNIPGLGIFKGTVNRFRTKLPVPQIGWNQIKPQNSPLFDGLSNFYAYFANSYYCTSMDVSCIAAISTYSISFPSAFWKKNIFATQFHPEKSGKIGLQILQNFIQEVKK